MLLTKAIRIKPVTLSLLTLLSLMPEAFGQAKKPLFNDAQLQITNYVQEGLRLNELGSLMGDKVGRAVVFGIPLQQKWDYSLSGERAPTYYLDTDASLYFYSFTDAVIGEQYLNLSKPKVGWSHILTDLILPICMPLIILKEF